MSHPLDTKNMEQIITASPQQLHDGLAAVENFSWRPPHPIHQIIIAGMGGSWMGGALLKEAEILQIPLYIHRAYGLPNIARKDDVLIIISSFSGNTEETLSAYDAAKEKGIPLVGIASGGKLEERCAADGTPFIKIPANPPTMQPRSATGYSFGILSGMLSKFNLAPKEVQEKIEELSSFLKSFMGKARERGRKLALQFKGATPIIYSSNAYPTVAQITKIKINENAKTPAFWNVFPELNHNEMIGWTNPQGLFHVLILQDPEDHPRVLKRMEITSSLLQEKGIRVSLVQIEGKTKLEKIFSTLLVGDWLSYHLALEIGVDPSPVKMVEDLKSRLK